MDVYYFIVSCNTVGPAIVGQLFLPDTALQLGWYVQTVENPNICFQITAIFDTDQGNPILTWVGPAFDSCDNCVQGIQLGCTDPTACNFNPCATIENGSCTYNNATIRILCNNPIETCS